MKRTFIHLQETDSTNRYIKDLPPSDDDMIVVTAKSQTAGRGQGSNTWESEAGKNLLFSMLVHPHFVDLDRQFVLSMVGALALKDTLDAYTDAISIKWPNDVYWRDRKISGTLIETRLAGQMLKDVLFGIGVNINQEVFLSDAPNPVSLSQITGREMDIDEVLEKFLQTFDKYYGMLEEGQEEIIIKAYHDGLYRKDGLHTYRDKDGEFKAVIVEVKPDGHLILRDDMARERCYAFKEVIWSLPRPIALPRYANSDLRFPRRGERC